MVCYEFKSDLARLLKAFPKGRALATSQDEDDFKAGKIPLLFLHPKSGGHGIDGFQYACNNIVFFGHNWSLGQYQQVIERIGPVRQMQAELNRPVFIHHIIARDTVDELVMERRETKKATQDLLLEACKRKLHR
jgi:SNF2 family DNA or RNA helicase